MRSRWSWMVMLLVSVPGTAGAAEHGAGTADASAAHQTVLAALEAEARGDFFSRERLLEEAARSGVAPVAKAQLGLIDVGTKKPDWKTIDESMSAAEADVSLLRYEDVRRQTPDTAGGHLELARWCLTRKLGDQARAHLTRLLDFVPDHAAARAALGYVRVGDRWVGPAEIRRLEARAAAKSRSIEQHRTVLAPLLGRLKSKEMARQNAFIEQVNQRIAAVIARVSGRLLTSDAADMWRWWDEYNETEYQISKADRVRRSSSVSTVSVSLPETAPSSEAYECFVAGTPVVTKRGLRPIETVLPGDLVLNRDLATAALRWKPVLKATARPPTATIAITLDGVGGETFRCSTGHLFWVSGTGWKKASELRANDVVHGAKAPARIARVEPQPITTTYNLEVADSPNYFVGRAMILTHDVTQRETNRQAFPGQDVVRQLSDPRAGTTASR